jgi:hypothetical protein
MVRNAAAKKAPPGFHPAGAFIFAWEPKLLPSIRKSGTLVGVISHHWRLYGGLHHRHAQYHKLSILYHEAEVEARLSSARRPPFLTRMSRIALTPLILCALMNKQNEVMKFTRTAFL